MKQTFAKTIHVLHIKMMAQANEIYMHTFFHAARKKSKTKAGSKKYSGKATK